jgi:endonuclease YncB( thermonuclease family)
MSTIIAETNEELNKCDVNTSFFSFDKEIHLARVTKCYDSNIFHCIFKYDGKYQKFHVKLYKCDTIESYSPKQEEKIINAKKKLEEYILNKNIYLYCKGFDKYGRILAEVKVSQNDMKTINDLMIEAGFGHEYSKQPTLAINQSKILNKNKNKKKNKIKINTDVDATNKI